MVFGFGRTEQYLTSDAVEHVIGFNPMRIDMRDRSLTVINAARASSDELRIAYASCKVVLLTLGRSKDRAVNGTR